MKDNKTALDRLRAANPVASVDGLPDDELQTLMAVCEDSRRSDSDAEAPGAANTSSLRPPWVRQLAVAAAAFVLVIAVFGIVGLATTNETAPGGTIPQESTPVPPPMLEVDWRISGDLEWVDAVVWYQDEETILTTSVSRSASGGTSMPIAVFLSELCQGCSELAFANSVARLGTVAFAPRWSTSQDHEDPAHYLGGETFDRVACLVGFAQHYAESLGGDPANVTVIGSGGGEHPALWLALGHADTSQCEYPMIDLPTRAVVGMGQYTMHMEYFDGVFEDDPIIGRNAVDAFLNPESWKARTDLEVLTWVTDSSSQRRDIETPVADDSWIHARDTTGTLITDLDELAAFDDGFISYDDNARLLERRLSAGGVDVTLMYEPVFSYTMPSDVFTAMTEMMGIDSEQ